VTWQPDEAMYLRGPAVLVGELELSAEWLDAAQR
jgi:hypothetical protein